MTKNFLGKSEFVFWFGVVESVSDPLQVGRVQVRIIGHHPDDQSLIPTSDLSWAQVILPATAAYIKSGTNAVGLEVGSHVLGFFIDGPNAQHPIILGSFLGISDNQAINTAIQSAANTRNSNKDSEEPHVYNPTYPSDSVEVTSAGHIFDVDNTPGSERILTEHKSGTFQEYQPDGSLVTHVLTNNYSIVAGTDYVHIKGNKTDKFDGDLDITISGNINLTCTGNINITSSEQVNITADAIALSKEGGITDFLVKLSSLETKFNQHTHGLGAPPSPQYFITEKDGTSVIKGA